jgi:ribose transport system permease protein
VTATVTGTNTPPAQRLSRFRASLTGLPLLQVTLLAVLFAYGSLAIDGFASRRNVLAMLVIASFIGFASAGQTLVVLLGGIDISIPFVIGAANVMTAELTGGRGWSLTAASGTVILLAAIIGATSGFLSHRFDVHPLIVTLGMGSMVGGGVLVWTNAELTGAAPAVLSRITSPAAKSFGLPVPPVVALWALLTLLLTGFLVRTASGRRLYATGASVRAARLALISTTRLWTATFAASAVLSGVTGILLAGFSGTGQFTIGDPYLFTTVAATVIGGTSLLGARGDYVRTVLGALILVQTTTILVGRGFDSAAQQVILGGLIVLFVASYAREPHVRTRI